MKLNLEQFWEYLNYIFTSICLSDISQKNALHILHMDAGFLSSEPCELSMDKEFP